MNSTARGVDRQAPPPSGTVTFLFTDIEGSTRLLEKLRDAYARVLDEQRDLLRDLFVDHNGFEVDTQGDSFFVAFSRAGDALRCAVAAQKAIAAHQWPLGAQVRVRMGMHTGEPVARRSGYVGMDVHRAARIAAAGHGGQILISGTTRDLVANDLPAGVELLDLGSHSLKDVRQPVAIFQVSGVGLVPHHPPLRTLSTGDEPAVPGDPPYKGLEHFDVQDSELFFGRTSLTAQLVERVRMSRFVAVIGASGSGKSSLARAGVVASLAQQPDGLRVIVLRPGERPLESLALAMTADVESVTAASTLQDDMRHEARSLHLAAARRPKGGHVRPLLVVVDQFEELFTLCADAVERQAFIDNLITAVDIHDGPVRALITLRADFYAHCAAFPRLRALIAKDQEYIGLMTADELREAIAQPAAKGGWTFAPGLVELILHDVGREPGALPLLSHALLETWRHRRGSVMTLHSYAESGGVRGAIARTADRVYNEELSERQQVLARVVFLRLTELGDATHETRRRVHRAELTPERPDAAAEMNDLLQKLVDTRLATASEDSVEVAHEALIREWPLLQQWLNDDRAALVVHRGLTQAAQEWERGDRDSGLLFRGTRLIATLDWLGEHAADANDVERSFVAASKRAAEGEAQRQRTVNRRLRALLAGVAVFLVLAVGAGLVAALLAQRANEAGALARSRELAASAIAALDQDPALSKLLALAAADIADPPLESISALHRAHAADPVIYRYAWPSDRAVQPPLAVDLDPTGRLMIVGGSFQSRSPVIEAVEIETGARAWIYDAGAVDVALRDPYFSPDGASVLVGAVRTAGDGAAEAGDEPAAGIHIIDAMSGALTRRLDVGPCGGVVLGVAQSRALVESRSAGAFPGCFDAEHRDAPPEIALIDIESGATTPVGGDGVAAISGDGRIVAFTVAATDDQPERSLVVDVATAELLLEISRPGRVWALNWNGSLVVHGASPMEVWDVGQAKLVAAYSGHSGGAGVVHFDKSDDNVVSTGRDGTLRKWDARTGQEVLVVPGVGGGAVSRESSGRLAVSPFDSATALVIDTHPRGEVGAVRPRATASYTPGGEDSGCFVPGSGLVSAGGWALFSDNCGGGFYEQTMHVIDIDPLAHAYSLAGMGGLRAGLSPDGSMLVRQEASGFEFGPLMIRDVATGAEVRQLDGLCTYRNSNDLPEVEPDCEPLPIAPFGIYPWDIDWSPDGRFVAVVDYYGGVVVWSAADGRLLHGVPVDGVQVAHSAVFSPDSSRLVMTRPGGFVEALSTETWASVARWQHGTAETMGLAGYTADGSTLVVVGGLFSGGGGSIQWLDSTTLQPNRPRLDQVTAGSPKSHAVSEDGALIAIGTSDGLLSVREMATGRLLHEIPFPGTEVQGVTFTGPARLAVALTPSDGSLLFLTLDRAELLDVVRSSLTRGFTPAECQDYGFEEDCPTLDEMRGD